MKRMFKLSVVAICSLVPVVFSGCLLSHSNHAIVRQNEPLKQIAFETEKARAYYEAKVSERLDNSEASASFGIPFIVGLEKSTTTSENAVRNDVATLLDINGDRVVSEYEANLQR
ncbi:MAG: hypothetical protein AB8B55_20000 [Mariniblastus sp.]